MPAWALVCFTFAAFLVTGLLAYTTITSDRTFRTLAERDLQLVDDLGTIIHLDEVLTMSARMAAVTGERRWIKRYNEFQPQLDRAIEHALVLAPDAYETRFLTSTEVANDRLVELERQSLELVEQGDLRGAADRLFGMEYETLKAEYKSGAEAARRSFEHRISNNLALHRRAIQVSGGISIGAAIGAFALLLLTARWMLNRQRLRQEMQVAMRRSTLGQLAASLAHELNQPLGAIVNYCAGARALADQTPIPPRVLDAVEKAEHQAARAGQIIQRIRAFVREQPAEPRPCDVEEIVRESLRLVQAEMRRAGVALRPPQITPARILADPIQLQQVLVNLLLNAIDACRDQPQPAVTVVAGPQDSQAVIEVRDSGPGVPKAFERNLFEPFRTTKDQGLGLGLSISRAIVEAHAGRLEYDRDSSSTVFRVRLPLGTIPP